MSPTTNEVISFYLFIVSLSFGFSYLSLLVFINFIRVLCILKLLAVSDTGIVNIFPNWELVFLLSIL